MFVKAYRKFYIQDLALRDIIRKTIDKIENIEPVSRTAHPLELIYKNLSECLQYLSNEEKDSDKKNGYQALAEKYASECQNRNKYADTTIDMIQINAKIEFMRLQGTLVEEGTISNLDRKEIEDCEKLLGVKAPINYSNLKKFLDEKLTYTYRKYAGKSNSCLVN